MENWQQQAIVDVFQNYQSALMHISILLVTGGVVLLLVKKYTKKWKVLGIIGISVAVIAIAVNHHIYPITIERLKNIGDIEGSYLLETIPTQCMSLGAWYKVQIICNVISSLMLFILLLFGREKILNEEKGLKC